MKHNKGVLLLIFLLVGLILRLHNLSQRSLWTDEFFTFFQSSGHGVELVNFLDSLSRRQEPQLYKAKEFKVFLKFDAAKNLQQVSEGLLRTDTHPPLYFWLMHYWMRVWGDSIFAVRLFSVLLGLFSVFLAYRLTLRLFHQQAANFAALLVSVSAFSVRYSQEARAYSLVMALGLLSCLFILSLEKEGKNSDALGLAVSNALGIYTHYFYTLLCAAQLLYFSLTQRKNPAVLNKFYLAFLCSWLSFAFWFVPVLLRGYNFYLVEWIFGYPGLGSKLSYLLIGLGRYLFIWDGLGPFWRLLLFLGLCIFVYLVKGATRSMFRQYPKSFWFSLTFFLVPLGIMFCIDLLQRGALLKQERFWVFPFLGFIPLGAYILAEGFAKNKFTYLLVFLMPCSSFLVAQTQFGPAPQSASAWINRETGGRPATVLAYNIRSVIPAQSYYLNDDIYLVPVSDERQLSGAVLAASGYAEKIFLVRHFHRSDASLMDAGFMGGSRINAGFKFKAVFAKDDISVSEYIR